MIPVVSCHQMNGKNGWTASQTRGRARTRRARLATPNELVLLAELVGPSRAVRLLRRFGIVRRVALAGDEELRSAGVSSRGLRTLRAAFELGLRANVVTPVGTRFGRG